MSFASGGRRRPEMAALPVEVFIDQWPMRADPNDENSPLLSIRLGYTKTTTSGDDQSILIGRPVDAPKHWLATPELKRWRNFGALIDQWRNIVRRALTPQSVN